MDDVGQHVPRQNFPRRHPERFCRRHEVRRRRLHRFRPQKTRQPRPTRHADDDGQKKEPQIRPLQPRFIKLRILVNEDLNEKHRRGNQEYRRYGRNHGVHILHRLIDPTAEVTRRQPQHHGKG